MAHSPLSPRAMGGGRQHAQDAGLLGRLSEAWGRQFEKALEQPYLLALMIGSLLLSIASFFTTFRGMLNFMPVWMISFCITFAIQALLFVTSWRIGFARADGQPFPWFTGFVFAICLATSVFFSWVALFETINDEDLQSRTRETRIHRAVEDTVSELHARSQALRRDQVENLLDSEVYNDWQTSVNKVADAATASRDALERALQDRARDVARRIATLESEVSSARREESTAEQRLLAAERDLQRLESQRPSISERVNRLRGELEIAEEQVVVQEGLMLAEETGGGENRRPGRGPKWRELRDQRNIMAAERDTKRTLLQQAQGELRGLDASIEETRATIAAGGASGASAKIAAAEQEISSLRNRLSGGVDGELVNLQNEVDKLRTNLSDFATQLELPPFNAAAEQCAQLLEAMQNNPELRGLVVGLSCDRAKMAEFMNPIGVSVENLKTLERECVAGGENAQSVTAMTFEESVVYGRQCISVSGLPARSVSDLRGEIDRLVLEEDPNASRFVKTVNAFTGGEKLSYFALAIAISIDILVLFSGLIGAVSTEQKLTRALKVDLEEHPRDPKRIRVAKAVLRNVQAMLVHDESGKHEDYYVNVYCDVTDLDRPDLQNEVRALLIDANAHGVAHPTRDNPNVFSIEHDFLMSLREEIADEQARMRRIYGEPNSVPSAPRHAFDEAVTAGERARRASPVLSLRPVGPEEIAETAAMARANAPSEIESNVIPLHGPRREEIAPADAAPLEDEALEKLSKAAQNRVPIEEATTDEEVDIDDFAERFRAGINKGAGRA